MESGGVLEAVAGLRELMYLSAVDGSATRVVGRSQIYRQLTRLEARARRSVWSTNPLVLFDPDDPGLELNKRSRRRGIDIRTITTPVTLRSNPIFSSCAPWARVGPVLVRMIIVDQNSLILEGAPTWGGELSAWVTAAPNVLDMSLELWSKTWTLSRAVLNEDCPPLNERQCAVATLICRGLTEAQIAASLGSSIRTVQRHTASILQWTNSTSRTEVVGKLMGRGHMSTTVQAQMATSHAVQPASVMEGG